MNQKLAHWSNPSNEHHALLVQPENDVQAHLQGVLLTVPLVEDMRPNKQNILLEKFF